LINELVKKKDFYNFLIPFRRGIKKAVNRIPILVKQKTGFADETVDHDYLQLDAEYDATAAANKELIVAFTSSSKAIRIFLHKLQTLSGMSEKGSVVEDLLDKTKALFDSLALPTLAQLQIVYKKVFKRMVKRRHKLFDYDRQRLALSMIKN
jgi:hypothetical protein